MKDKKKFYQLSYELMATTTFNPTQKLLIAAMLADQEMNGHIKWSKSQYAEKIAATRDFVSKFFKHGEFDGLISKGHSKQKYGTYYKLDMDQLDRLIQLNDKKVWPKIVEDYSVLAKLKGPAPKFETSKAQSETTSNEFETTESEFETSKTQFETTHIDINTNLIEKEIEKNSEETDSDSSLKRIESSSSEESKKDIPDDELIQFAIGLDLNI